MKFCLKTGNDNQQSSSPMVKPACGHQIIITICVLIALHVSQITFTTTSGDIMYIYTRIIRRLSYNFEIKRTYISQTVYNNVTHNIIWCKIISTCCGCPSKKGNILPRNAELLEAQRRMAHPGGHGSPYQGTGHQIQIW